jgi:hypothetical protein
MNPERARYCERCERAPGSCLACGGAPDERVGQTQIRWSAACPTETRTKLRAEIAEIKPQRRASRIGPRAARATWERRGERALAAPDVPELTDTNRAYHRHVVRVYYRSMGDEILCFESRGLTEAESHTLHGAHARRRDVFGKKIGAPGSDALDAELHWQDDDAGIPPVGYGARLVTLPSQRAEPVEVIDAGEAPAPEAPAPEAIFPVTEGYRGEISVDPACGHPKHKSNADTMTAWCTPAGELPLDRAAKGLAPYV